MARQKSEAKTGGAKEGRADRDGQRERLEKELRGLLPGIDKEGLIFLLRQAQVLLHNRQIEKLNREIEELRDTEAGDGAAVADHPPLARPALSIEEAELGDSFTLVVRGKRSILTVSEMRQIVRYCYAAASRSEAQRQLHAWFVRERKDILLSAGVQNPQSAFFQSLFEAVRARFRLKDR